MKKIYLALFALASILITSCSNEEIEITSKGKLCDLTCQINVRAQYEEFDEGGWNTSGDIEELLRKKYRAVGITALLYDMNGELVCQPEYLTQYSLNNASLSFRDILEGQYSLVTIEMLTYLDEEQSDRFSITGIEHLSTLQIVQKTPKAYYHDLIGVNTCKVNLQGDEKISITPKVIGSMIYFYSYNFDESPYISIGLGTIDMIDSYKLDPSLAREDRFYKDLSDEGYFCLRGGYEGFVDGYNMSLYVLESSINYSFRFKEEEDIDNNYWTYYLANSGTLSLEDGQQYYAGFYYFNEENVPSHYLGNYDGFESWLDKAINQENEYNNENNIIPDLYMTWGGSVKNTQSFMSDYEMLVGESGRAILQENGSYGLEYRGKGQESYIDYYYTSATTGLYDVDVWYYDEDVSVSTLISALDENYLQLSEDNDKYYYISNDYTTVIILYDLDGMSCLAFYDYNYVSGSNVRVKAPIKDVVKKSNKRETVRPLKEKEFVSRNFFEKQPSSITKQKLI